MSVIATGNTEFIRNYLAEMHVASCSDAVIERFVSDEGLKQKIRWARSIAPGYEVVPEQIVSEGDTVAIRGKVNGIQQGEFNGIPPNGKPFSVDVAVFYRVKDGKIVDQWMLFDRLEAINQLKA